MNLERRIIPSSAQPSGSASRPRLLTRLPIRAGSKLALNPLARRALTLLLDFLREVDLVATARQMPYIAYGSAPGCRWVGVILDTRL